MTKERTKSFNLKSLLGLDGGLYSTECNSSLIYVSIINFNKEGLFSSQSVGCLV